MLNVDLQWVLPIVVGKMPGNRAAAMNKLHEIRRHTATNSADEPDPEADG